MSKHPTYKFEVKGYSSEDVQNIYRYLDLGSQVYINENLYGKSLGTWNACHI